MKQRKQNFCIPSHSSLGSRYARHILLATVAVLTIAFLAACSNNAQPDRAKQNQPDISRLGQLQYGCALVRQLNQTHQSKDDWKKVLSLLNGMDRIYAIVGLFHGVNPPDNPPDNNGLPKTGWRILKSAMTLKLEDFIKAMDTAMAKCKNLKDRTNKK